jgi:hypothetical protein
MSKRFCVAFALLAVLVFGRAADADPGVVGPCDPKLIPQVGEVPQCCQETGPLYTSIYLKAVEAFGGILFVRDHLTGPTPGSVLQCRLSNGDIGCDTFDNTPEPDCDYGPRGAADGGLGEPNTSDAVVFFSNTDPTQCGRDSNGTDPDGGYEFPEPYVNQELAPGSRTSAPDYTACRSDGQPGTVITLSAECLGTSRGTVRWRTHSVSCDAATNPTVTQDIFIPGVAHGGRVLYKGSGFQGWGGGDTCVGLTKCLIPDGGNHYIAGFFSVGEESEEIDD